MNKLKLLELFGGIGACSKALERLGIDYEIVDYVDNDKFAVRSFNAIHDTYFEVQDITQWDKQIDVDLIMHGSPCQDFSLSGKQAGGDEGSGTRSSLMYETIRIVKKLKPKYVIWENVKNIISKKHVHNFNNYINRMSELGYKSFYKVLNAKDYGIPQNRERVFTVSILDESDYEFPKPMPLKLKLKDMLEDEVDEKYFLSDAMMNCFMSDGTGNYPRKERFLQNINRKNQDIGNTITSRAGDRPTDNFIKVKNATKKGYDEATNGDSVNLSYPNSKTRRGRVGKQVSQTLQCNDAMGVVEKGRYSEESLKRIKQNIIKNDIANTLTANAMQSFNHNNCALINNDLRIRKLTPKECWHLMGFDDEDFEKASQVCSNTQLYKQAGNSIVVNVLEAIFRNLF